MTLECVHNNNIAVFVVQYNYVVGPMARPGARGLGPGLGLNYDNCVAGRPGLDILFAHRAGHGPHNSVCGPGPGQVCTTAAGPGRAWASNHICGPGLGLHFRSVQGPSVRGRLECALVCVCVRRACVRTSSYDTACVSDLRALSLSLSRVCVRRAGVRVYDAAYVTVLYVHSRMCVNV